MSVNNVKICGAVLAGGGSTRMGTDKSQMTLGGQRVLDRIFNTLEKVVPRVFVNCNYTVEPYPCIKDQHPGNGPLGGIHAVLDAADEGYVTISACDTPFIDPQIIEAIKQHITPYTDAVIPVYGGRVQPLSGIYHQSLAPLCEELISREERKVVSLLEEERCRVTYVHDFTGMSEETLAWHFFNMNTKKDFEEAMIHLEKSSIDKDNRHQT